VKNCRPPYLPLVVEELVDWDDVKDGDETSCAAVAIRLLPASISIRIGHNPMVIQFILRRNCDFIIHRQHGTDGFLCHLLNIVSILPPKTETGNGWGRKVIISVQLNFVCLL